MSLGRDRVIGSVELSGSAGQRGVNACDAVAERVVLDLRVILRLASCQPSLTAGLVVDH